MAKKPSAVSSQPERLVRKSAADIRAYAKSPKFKADAERLRRHTAPYAGEPSPEDLAEMPELTDDELASLVRVTHKRPVTLRLDSDVIEWLKEGGPKYQTRANDYLRSLMNRSRQLKAKSRG